MYPIGHMRRNKQIAARDFRFGMDSDSENLSLPPGWYKEAHNIEGGYGNEEGAKVYAYGNRKINYDFPPGDGPFQVMWAVENRAENTLIYFVHDDSGNNNHLILEYSRQQETIKELFRGNIELNRVLPVHSAVIVAGYLYWADGMDFADGFDLIGSAPKKLEISRFRPGKLIRYELILNADAYLEDVAFSYSLYALDGTLTQADTPLVTILAGASRADVMLALFNALDTEGFILDNIGLNTADMPAYRLVFSYGSIDHRVVISVSGGVGSPKVELNELNYYPLAANGAVEDIDQMMFLIRPTPPCPPEAKYVEDASLSKNDLHGSAFQFRYRYVFENNQKSAWGPASRVPTNFASSPGSPNEGPVDAVNSSAFNKIVITIDDPYTKAPWRWLTRKVELAYRRNRDDSYKLVGVFDLYKFTLDEIAIDFTNDGIRQVVPSDDIGPENVQALKNYDAVPLVAGCLEAIYDKEGNAILALGGGNYSYELSIQQRADVSYQTESIAAPSTSEQTSSHKGLKRGGVYRVGIIYKDNPGSRLSSVVPLQSIQIPATLEWTSGDYEIYNLRVEVFTPPPTWAKWYQVVISENLNQEIYWQAAPADINRYNVEADTGNLVADISGNYYGFEYPLDQLAPIPNDMAFIFDKLNSSSSVFTPENKDRIQIYKIDPSWTGPPLTPVNADTPNYNYRIEGYGYIQTGTPTKTTLVVLVSRKQAESPEVIFWDNFFAEGYCNTEIYRPKTAPVKDIYYEFGPCQEITFAHHVIIPLQGWGDTYTTRDFNTPGSVVLIKERPTLYPENTVPEWDLGRAVAYDPNYGEKYMPTIIRGSDPYIQGTSINGLNAFREADFITAPESIGPLKRLVMNQTVLLAIGSFKTQPVYVSKDRLLALNATVVGRTEQLFNIADEVKFDMGTLHPESVLYEQGATYGYDARTTRFWRYTAGSGQFPISDHKQAKAFQALAYLVDKPALIYKFPCGFDRERKSLYVTNDNFTAIFKETDEPHWVSYIDFLPEAYGRLNRNFFSFKAGQLYIHDKFATPGKYFDASTKPASITFVVNDMAEAMKLFDSIEIDSNIKWYSPEIIIKSGPDYSDMRSRIPANKWGIYEGSQKAEFMRDGADPSKIFADLEDESLREAGALLSGRPLRGRSIQIKLELVTPGQTFILRRAYIYYQLSPQTVSP